MTRLRAPTAGFVLPYVLAVIVILSLITVLGAEVLRRSVSSATAIESKYRYNQALDRSERIVMHLFLKSPMAGTGLRLRQAADQRQNRSAENIQDLGVSQDEDIWQANGTWRQLNLDGLNVYIMYQDVAGLISLNFADTDIIERALASGLGEDADVTSLTAKLVDYRDTDARRSFQGGERADYRLKRLHPPTNSSLRTLKETSRVMDWGLSSPQLDFVTRNFTVLFGASRPIESRMRAETKNILNLAQTDLELTRSESLLQQELLSPPYPSETGRFTFLLIDPNTGVGLERIIEIQRQSGSADQAFYRRLITQDTVISEDYMIGDSDEIAKLPLPWASNN